MTERRPPRVRCYSFRHSGRAADLCHALSIFVAIKSNAGLREALRKLGIEPDQIAELRLEHQTWALCRAEELLEENWRLAEAKLNLIEFCQRAVFRAHVPSVEASSPGAGVSIAKADEEFREFSHVRADARRIRDDLARVLAQVRSVLRRERLRPFASTIANDNPAEPKASGAGE